MKNLLIACVLFLSFMLVGCAENKCEKGRMGPPPPRTCQMSDRHQGPPPQFRGPHGPRGKMEGKKGEGQKRHGPKEERQTPR